MCFNELFQILSPLFFVEHCLLHEISHTRCLLPAENTWFSPEMLEHCFPFWAGCSRILFSSYSPPWWTWWLCLGSIQAGHTWSPPVCLQGQRVMLTALSPSPVSQLGCSDVSSKGQLLPSSLLFSPLLIFTGKLKKLSCEVRGHVWSP